jgi:hypothetical protein
MKYDKEDLDVDKTLLMKKLQKLGYTVSEDASTVMSPAGASHAFDAVWSPGKGGMNAVIDVFFHKGAWSIYATAGNGKATSKRFMDVGELAKELDTLGAQLIDKTKYAYEKSKQPKKAF